MKNTGARRKVFQGGPLRRGRWDVGTPPITSTPLQGLPIAPQIAYRRSPRKPKLVTFRPMSQHPGVKRATLDATEDATAASAGHIARNHIALYRALGGGPRMPDPKINDDKS